MIRNSATDRYCDFTAFLRLISEETPKRGLRTGSAETPQTFCAYRPNLYLTPPRSEISRASARVTAPHTFSGRESRKFGGRGEQVAPSHLTGRDYYIRGLYYKNQFGNESIKSYAPEIYFSSLYSMLFAGLEVSP